jgi:hypothetical protein
MATYERFEEYKSIPVASEITVRALIFLVVYCEPEGPFYVSLVTSSLSTTTAMVVRKVLLSVLSPTALCVEYIFITPAAQH